VWSRLGGITVWVAGQTATQDSQGNNIANNFEAQVKQVFAQVDGVLKRAKSIRSRPGIRI
jgi:2-iminobutanoate/2-iminopropanoate deaminase